MTPIPVGMTLVLAETMRVAGMTRAVEMMLAVVMTLVEGMMPEVGTTVEISATATERMPEEMTVVRGTTGVIRSRSN
jgi:hypothetical protein